MFSFNPVPKPKFKKVKARVRTSISKKEYQKAIDKFGSCCVICQNPRIEMHHVKFRSQGGKGVYRNLVPLCEKHHRLAHTQRWFAEALRNERENMFGKYYWCDKRDLFKIGLIKDDTDWEFEKFMIEETMKK